MKAQKVYCSGCDREVQVLLEDAGHDDAQANVHDPELICLEIGAWCTGNLCPLGAAEPNAMVSRMIHSGLPLHHLEMERGFCESCGMENDLGLYGQGMVACTVCGTTWKRAGATGPQA